MKKLIKRLSLLLLGVILLVLVLNYQPERSVESLKAKYANAASQFVEVDNMPVHYRNEGNPQDSTPIVLIHGTGSNLLTWDGWTKSLTDAQRRVIRLDLPAYGLTGPNPNGDYTMEFYVQFLHHFLEKINVKRCHIAGNSLGGRIAWGFAATFPETVDRLILVDAAGMPAKSTSQPLAFRLATVPVINQLFTRITPQSVVEKSLQNVYVDDSKVTPRLVEQYMDMACREGNRKAFVERMNVLNTDNSAVIRTIKHRTLILWGAHDALIPIANAHQFEKDLENDSLLIFNDLGHVPHEENPQKTVSAVLDFLKK